MKNYFLILSFLGVLCGLDLRAQQLTQFSQYYDNQLYYNPAFAAKGDQVNAGVLYRSQWQGFEGAPQSISADFKMPFVGNKMGAGLHVLNDELGLMQNTSIQLDYAYRLRFNDSYMSLGISGGLVNQRIDNAAFVPPTGGGSDPILDGIDRSGIAPVFGVGVLYVSKKWYLGLAARNVVETSTSLESVSLAQARHVYLTGAYSWAVNSEFVLEPSALIQSDFNTFQAETNVRLHYKERLVAGLGYRLQEALILSLGYELFEGLRLGYSYDFGLSDLSGNYADGSHEIILRYRFDWIRSTDSPEREKGSTRNVRFL